MRRLKVAVACAVALLVSPAHAQQEASPAQADEVTDLVNTLLGGLLGTPEDATSLQREVEEAGGVAFRRDVPIDFIGRRELGAYVRELLDEEYPAQRALADQRTLQAFDLLPADVDLRRLRARLLEENVAGFYDERPGRRKLYSVSEDRTLTPMNQIVLAHELRHALQDQYAELHTLLSEEISDFDDRRIAVLSLFEGDATLVMERFVKLRLGLLGAEGALDGGSGATNALAPGLADLPGAPAVVRDQLVQPYIQGLTLARALFARGGGEALREAWSRPPESSEQVLHPQRYFSRETPRLVAPRIPKPRSGQVVSEGVLGELLLRTLLGDGQEEAAAGWGGDGWRAWDVGGKTVLAWRSEWDSPADAGEFHEALLRRFARLRGPARTSEGWTTFTAAPWVFAIRRQGDAIELLSGEDAALVEGLLAAGEASRSGETLDIPGGSTTVPGSAPDMQKAAAAAAPVDPGPGNQMATPTPPANPTNLGMAPNVAGLLCYVPCCIGLVFSVVAAIVEKQSRFVRFHAFQSLLLHGVLAVLVIGFQVLNAVLSMAGLGMLGLLFSLVFMVLGLGFLGLTVFLMIKANAEEEFVLPVIGPMAKGWA